MVFGIATTTKLQNDIFCLTEERDYFQAKFLEQVSEIASLKDELQKSKKEIARLRRELMEQGSSQHCRKTVDYGDAKPPQHRLQEEKKENDDDHDYQDDNSNNNHQPKNAVARATAVVGADGDTSTISSLQPDDVLHHNHHHHDDEDDENEEDSATDIRQSAEKLLQWASYRSIQRTAPSTPDQSIVSTRFDSRLDSIPRTIQSIAVPDNDESDEDDYEDEEDHTDDEYDESDLDDH